MDQYVVHNSRAKGFRVYNRVVKDVKDGRGQLVDALYHESLRYLITTASAPLITFYDVHQFRVRQVTYTPHS